MLIDDDVAACAFSGIFITLKVLGLTLRKFGGLHQANEMIAEQENKFWKDCEKRDSSIKVLKDTSG